MLTNETLLAIREEVELNDHGEAYRLAALALQQFELATRIARNRQRQLDLGHLPLELEFERNVLRKELWACAQQALNVEDLNQLRLLL